MDSTDDIEDAKNDDAKQGVREPRARPTQDVAAKNDAKAEGRKVEVTLIRGKSYSQRWRGGEAVNGFVKFEARKPRPVSKALADYLRENAIDIVTVEGRPEERCKFKFS